MTFILSKLLPLLVLPLGLSLMLLLLGLICRRRWPVILALINLWFFSLGLVNEALWRSLESPWERNPVDLAQTASAIVVLSGGRHPAPGSSRISEWHDSDRFLAGIELYRASKAPRLLFTGGANPFSPGQPLEGNLYLEEARELGIPQVAMSSTPPVLNTAQEAKAIRKILGNSQSILLVTSAFHMRRAQRLFERQGLKVKPFPVDFRSRGSWAGPAWRDPRQWFPDAKALDGSSRALRELLGQVIYRIW